VHRYPHIIEADLISSTS